MAVQYKDVHPSQDKTITYKIADYPPFEDEKLEALHMLSSAHGLFFGLAENGVGVNKIIRDPETQKPIYDRKRCADIAIQNREKLCLEFKGDKFALAKLAGAYINMLGILADETTEIHLKGKEAAEAAGKKYHTSDAEKANLKKMDFCFSEARKSLPNIRLKGRKADMDGVLLALMGEFTKPSGVKIKEIRDASDTKIANTMYETNKLISWMEEVITHNPKLEPCRTLVQGLGKAAIERLRVGRDDLERDRWEIMVRSYSRQLRKTFRHIIATNEGPEKLSHPSRDLRRGSDVIFDMLKEGEKGASVTLVMGIEQARSIISILQKMPETLADKQRQLQVAKAVSEPLKKLQKATQEHLERFFNDGEPNPIQAGTFAKALKEAEEAANAIDISRTLKSDKIRAIKQDLLDGIQLIKTVPEVCLTGQVHLPEKRKILAGNIKDFMEKYNNKSSLVSRGL